MDFDELLDATLKDAPLKRDIRVLLEQKKQGLESDYVPPIASISRFIAQELDNLGIPDSTPPTAGMGALNCLFLAVLES
jgi:predicted nucleotidyltransferase